MQNAPPAVPGAPERAEPHLGLALVTSVLLDDDSQARLRAELACAGWPVSDLGQLDAVALGEVTEQRHRRRLRNLFHDVLTGGWDTGRAGDTPLGQIFPGCQLLADGAIPEVACGARLRNVLDRSGWTRWVTVADRTIPEAAALSNVGALALAELVALCFERSLEGVAASVRDATADDLTVVLRNERGGRSQPVLEALLDLRRGDAPCRVRDAAQRLVHKEAPWALDHDAAVAALLQAAGDERSQSLFRIRSSRGAPCRSLQKLAGEVGISAPAADRIVRRFEARLRATLNVAPGPLPWVVSRLRTQLGSVTTAGQVDDVMANFEIDGPTGDVVLWLAGPYEPVPSQPGWLALEARTIVAHTASCLAADGGVRRLVDVEAELGLSGRHLVSWLQTSGATVVHDVAVSLAGPLPGVVERILDAHGRALLAPEIADCLRDGGRVTTDDALGRALRAKRFVRRPDATVALGDWDAEMPPSTQPPSPGRQVGPTEIPTTADVKGLDPAHHDDRLWLWVKVDADVLRGVEAVVPGALVDGLGMTAACRRTFSSRYGPILLASDGLQPTRGSLRAVAMAAGARHGDTVLLAFSRDGDVHVEVRGNTGPIEAADPTALPSTLFAHLATGGTP